jgi:signal transduction histidine kinase
MQIQQNYSFLIGEGQPLAGDGLIRLIRCEADLPVIAEAENGRDAVQLREGPPASALKDLNIAPLDGAGPDAQIDVLTRLFRRFAEDSKERVERTSLLTRRQSLTPRETEMFHHTLAALLGMLLAIALLFAACLAVNGCQSHRANKLPVIKYTKIPPAAQGGREKVDTIAGRVTGARSGQQIVIYAHSGAWWVEPTVASPFTPTRTDSTWSTETHLGYEYAVLSVDPGYRPPPTMDTPSSEGGPIVLVAIVRGIGPTILAPAKPLNFSGYDWDVRTIASDREGSSHRHNSDNVWTDSKGAYGNLHPGNYRFLVMASNSDGIWNSSEAGIRFAVEPTLVQTWWFRALLLTCAGLAALAIYRLRVHHLTRLLNVRFEERLAERARIARELHDTLLQGFQGITLRMQGVSKNMPIDDPPRKMMEEVLDRADEVMREARQRVRGLRRRTSHESELPSRLAKFGEELSQDHAANFTLAIVGTPKVLESTLQDEAYSIAGEALSNAFRHASASRIEVEVTYHSSALTIRVRDDGVGMDKAVLMNGQPGHWGLVGMRERAQAIRAKLKMWSREAAGTEVELAIPASIAYPREHTKASKTRNVGFKVARIRRCWL